MPNHQNNKNNKESRHHKESAGKLMTSKVPLVFASQPITDVRSMLIKRAKEFESINYLYVVDKNSKLIGVISMKDALTRDHNLVVSDIMGTELVKARASTDREKVALLALKHNLKAIPVVDKENTFLGVVTSDVILDVLYKEHTEDVLLAGGFSRGKHFDNLINYSVVNLVKIRVPWLLIGLAGGILAAQIIGIFEETLRSLISLVFFIPIVVYLAGAVSTQSATIFIRSIAVDSSVSIKKYFFREIIIGIILGLILGLILGVFAFWAWNDMHLGIILAVSVFWGVIFSVIFAITIPFILWKLQKDPAVGTSPLATILSDILSVAVYLIIARALLSII